MPALLRTKAIPELEEDERALLAGYDEHVPDADDLAEQIDKLNVCAQQPANKTPLIKGTAAIPLLCLAPRKVSIHTHTPITHYPF